MVFTVSCGNRDAETVSYRTVPDRPSMLGGTPEENKPVHPEKTRARMPGEIDFDTIAVQRQDTPDTVVMEEKEPEKPPVVIKKKPTLNNASLQRAARVRQDKVEEYDREMTKCYSLKGNAITSQDALDCAEYHWKMSREILRVSDNVDSAYMHCEKGLRLYENGSLFALKAKILMKINRYAQAGMAAERSIARNDHWDRIDRVEAFKIRYKAYRELYRLYPSTESLEKAEKSKNELAIEIGRVVQ
jgi:hypothetical protein